MSGKLSSQIGLIVDFFKPKSNILVLTGAGMSEESGIPTFRGKNGLWTKYDPNEVATAEAIKNRLDKVWEMHQTLRKMVAENKPNPGHYAVSDLEKIFTNVTVITQNVDNYHQDAGSLKVIEVHGNAWRVKCTKENKSWVDKTLEYETLPPKCSCGAPLRPDVIFFNEPLKQEIIESAFTLAAITDIILVIGTSCVVYPAAYIPILAKESGAKLIEVNEEYTPISHLADASLIGKAGEILPELVKKLNLSQV